MNIFFCFLLFENFSSNASHQTLQYIVCLYLIRHTMAQRMPLLQGPVWWQTVEQLRVMLESLRRTVGGDLCTVSFIQF